MFCKKGVLRNFAKFTAKNLSQSLFFNKVAALRPATLLKKSLWHRCFPLNFAKFLRTPFFMEHLCWLLLYTINYYIISQAYDQFMVQYYLIFSKMIYLFGYQVTTAQSLRLKIQLKN